MSNQIYIQGVSKYVEISAGYCLVNGEVLFVSQAFRVSDQELVGASGGDFGDYYIYLRPNRKVMESYYSKNWEYLVKSTSAGGTAPTINPDEILIVYVQKRLDGSGNTTLTVVENNRDGAGNATKRLIDSKDISYGAIKLYHLDASLSSGIVLRYSTNLGIITAGSPLTISHGLGTTDIIVQVYEISTGIQVEPDIVRISNTQVTLGFANNYVANTFRVAIIG